MRRLVVPVVFAFSTILVSGCSSDSSDDGGTPSTTLSGTAATGAPINGTVFVRGAKGIEKSVATSIDGSFTLDVPGMTSPYILKIMPSSGPELYSFAKKNGQTVNLTPTTNLAMFIANGKKDLNDLYSNWNGTGVSSIEVDVAEAIVRANLENEMTANGVDAATFNLFTSKFSADKKGFDAVMDDLKVAVDPGAGTFTFTDANDVDMVFDESADAILPPEDPAPADAISIATVSGRTHKLNGTYKTVCYTPNSAADGQIDSVTVTGSEWINRQEVFANDNTCSGSPTASGFISATITKGSDKVITGWDVNKGGAPARLGGNGLISETETVTAFTLTDISKTDPDDVYDGFVPPTTPVPGFYVFDDTGSGFAMYRSRDGDMAGKSDPYVTR